MTKETVLQSIAAFKAMTAEGSITPTVTGNLLSQILEYISEVSEIASLDSHVAESLQEIQDALTDLQASAQQIEDSLAGTIAEAQTAINTAKAAAIEEISEFGGVEVVQETGESTTAVMSQKAATDMLEGRYKDYYVNWLMGTDNKSYKIGDVFFKGFSTSGSYASYRQMIIDVSPGDSFYISELAGGYFSNNHLAYVIFDADDIILDMSSDTRYTNLSLTMPDNASGLYICYHIDYVSATPIVYKLIGIDDVPVQYGDWEDVKLERHDVVGRGFTTFPPSGDTFPYSVGWGVEPARFIPVTPGEVLRINSLSRSNSDYNFCFLDINSVSIYSHPKGKLSVFSNAVFTVPDGACYFVINSEGTIQRKRVVVDYSSAFAVTESRLAALCENAPTSGNDNAHVKRLTLGWCSDTHGDGERYRRFIGFCNIFRGMVNGVLHTGDMCRFSMTDYGFSQTISKYLPDLPFISVLGNHDAFGYSVGISGVTRQRLTSGTRQYNAEQLLKPYVSSDAVWGTDYDAEGNDGYYYKDFASQKIRMIMLNCYDCPRWCDGTNWQTTSDSAEIASAVDWVSGTSYAVGDIVKYKGLYLKCLVAGTLVDDGSTYSGAQDRYCFSKYNINNIYYDQKQVDFLINALSSMSSGWSAVICQHMVMESQTASHEVADNNWQASNAVSSGVMSVSFTQNGYILQDILSAYLNKSTLNKTYEAVLSTSNPLGSVTKVNNTSELPNVTANADFSSASGDIICCLAGHTHADANFFSKQTGTKKILQLCLSTSCFCSDSGSTRFNFCGDLNKGGTLGKDCFNVISFDTVDKYIYLMRVGADMTANFTERKFTRISYAH